MNKIESLAQISKIKANDIIVKYPSDGLPVSSFAGRNLENSIAYEVGNKHETEEVIDFIIPDSGSKEDQEKVAFQKTYEDLLNEKVWWIAKY